VSSALRGEGPLADHSSKAGRNMIYNHYVV
jgi:hypothetical protein